MSQETIQYPGHHAAARQALKQSLVNALARGDEAEADRLRKRLAVLQDKVLSEERGSYVMVIEDGEVVEVLAMREA